jgi:hypothetical protein
VHTRGWQFEFPGFVTIFEVLEVVNAHPLIGDGDQPDWPS